MKGLVVTFSAAALLLGVATLTRAEELDEATKARIARFEQGPATIDVSKYPAELQRSYKVFANKCSQCHKLSRPINSDYALPQEWSRYVKRMMFKPGSGISGGNGKAIYEFLVYDSVMRKKALLDEKLAKASPDEQKEAEKRIKEVLEKYGEN